jgi:hypothetical protein
MSDELQGFGIGPAEVQLEPAFRSRVFETGSVASYWQATSAATDEAILTEAPASLRFIKIVRIPL